MYVVQLIRVIVLIPATIDPQIDAIAAFAICSNHFVLFANHIERVPFAQHIYKMSFTLDRVSKKE